MSRQRILVVDDEKLVCWTLEKLLTEEGYHVKTAGTGKEAREIFNTFAPKMVLLDIRLPDANGIDLLEEFKERDDDLVVVMITAYADADSAVKALRLGADDYIGKPFNLDTIKHVVEKTLEKKRLRDEVNYLRREFKRKYDFDNLVGNSLAMIQVFKMIKVCAETDAPTVLILGESGTGKELVARSIHFHSPRKDAPFMEINCAAIPENLLENELFGHEKGAFTDASKAHKGIFAAAEGGTVFLDEIGDMPLSMQAKILKVIDNKRYRRLGGVRDIEANVRIIAATNQNLPELVNEGKFRGDLFFRLNVMTIHLPPLRERKEDIPALVRYFIKRFNEEYGMNVKDVSKEALDCFMKYDWPGNVRELRNTVERAMMFEQGEYLSISHLSPEIKRFAEDISPSPQTEEPLATRTLTRVDHKEKHSPQAPKKGDEGAGKRYTFLLPEEGISLEDVERQLIEQALDRFDWNQTKAASCLGLTRDTLRYRMKKFGLLGKKATSP